MMMDVKAVRVLMAAVLFAGGMCSAANLVPDGDFSAAEAGKIKWCRLEAGRFLLFTEDSTWNKCGKLEITKVVTNGNGIVSSAHAVIGHDGTKSGFAVKPNTTYDFSVDLRGGASSANINILEFTGDDFYRDRRRIKTTPKMTLAVEKEWKTYKGSFHTSADAQRAGVQVQLWSSDKGGALLSPGEFVLVDNVKVEESVRNLGSTKTEVPVVRRKAVVSGGEAFEDFVNLRTGARAVAKTSVRVIAKNNAFGFDIRCESPKGVVAHEDGNVWSGDSVELWFGSAGGDRFATQVAIGANGAKYVAVNKMKVSPDVVEAQVSKTERGWSARVRVPFETIGWTSAKRGDRIAFNVGRSHAENDYDTWSPLKTNFSDTANFGELVYDDYSAALKDRFGIDVACTERSAYEVKVAEAESAERQAKLDRFKGKRFSVAQVPVTSDYAVPFLPPEIFDPPTEIKLTAAVNEQKALPVAIANLSERVEDYVVLLETCSKPHQGDFGLAGFPKGNIAVRKALRVKDADVKVPTLRLDALPAVGEIPSVTIPPKEAGLVWFDFDTAEVLPGTYSGRLRVIPLGGFGSFKTVKTWNDIAYTGDMQVVPVVLEVLPIELPKRAALPSGFYTGGLTEEAFGLQVALGAEYFALTPWNFHYKLDESGDIDLSQPTEKVEEIKREVRDHLAWGKKCGIRPRFIICYNAVYAFRAMYNPKKSPDIDVRLWPQFILGVKKTMDECGVDVSDYSIETYDEPPANDFASIRSFHEKAKNAAPGVRILVTLGARKMKVEELRALSDVTDAWIVWDDYFANEQYRQLFAEQKQIGKRVYHYTCATSPRVELDSYYRKKAWFGEKYGLDGNMMFEFADLQGGLGARDFKVTTFGGIAQFLFEKAIPTVRYMAFREGITDWKYFAALRTARPNDPAVEDFVLEAIQRAMVSKRHDPKEPDRLRERAARMILGSK